MTSAMRAAVVTAPGTLSIQEIERPRPGPYQCLCRTLYGAICTGTDLHLLEQHEPFCHWIALPFILGHESVGRVVETGERVRNFAPGDVITRVGAPATDGIASGWGGFAEFTIAHDWQAMQEDGEDPQRCRALSVNQVLPPDVDPAEGTMYITWRETHDYVRRIGVGRGSRVLILGSGSNGLALANHAANAGAATVHLVGSAQRLDLAGRAGASATFDYRDRDVLATLHEAAPQGYDVVMDVIGTPTTLALAQACVADEGTLGIYGLDDPGSLRLDPHAGFGSWRLYRGGKVEGDAHQAVLDDHRAGRLQADLWVDRERAFELDDLASAFDAVRERSLVKPLIRLTGD